jgi:hypothetical protein
MPRSQLLRPKRPGDPPRSGIAFFSPLQGERA